MELVDIVQDLNAVEVYIVVHEACGNLIKWMIWAHQLILDEAEQLIYSWFHSINRWSIQINLVLMSIRINNSLSIIQSLECTLL